MDLCIGCASSISTTSTTQLPTTPCCNRKICLRCDATNPRLKTYNPCLSCFGAADVVTSAPETNKRALKVGGVDPDDVFVVGGEDEDEDDDDDETPPPPMYNELENATHTAEAEFATTNILAPEVLVPSSDLGEGSAYSKSEYWIKPKDTLSGIALKYGVDARTLCRLNELPPSTLSTTPHLLHTRTTLTLPPSARRPASPPPPDAKERLERRAKERAAKRLQFVTKEVDFRVAKAYVSLADGDHDHERTDTKKIGGGGGLEERAVERYLDDEEWEAEQRRMGQTPLIQGFPYFESQRGGKDRAGQVPEGRGAGEASTWKLWKQITAT